MKLIEGWKTSYKLYSVQVGVLIALLSIADGVLRTMAIDIIPAWVYTLSAVLLVVLRNVDQFMGRVD